jgi:HAD superfamily hydrolase (TIGR01509 family)
VTLSAVLLDMDGLLVDTEPVWTVAEVELARQLGGEFTPDLKAAIVGTRLEVAVPTILRWYGGPTDDATVARTMAWLLGRMVELFAEQPAVLPGVPVLLASLAEAGVPTALVSSSYRVLVDAVLAHGIGPFDLTVAGDEVAQGKPHPEPYLLAATRLGADPARCVVLEDSPAGVASAEAAGCAVVAVPSVPGVAFAPGPRRLVVPTLESVSLSDLQSLVALAA